MKYAGSGFTSSFEKYFSILKKEKAGNSGRTLFLMKKNA
jgi:hypothetical protein